MEQLSMRRETFECICVHTCGVFVCLYRCMSTCVHACRCQCWMSCIFQSLYLTILGRVSHWAVAHWLDWSGLSGSSSNLPVSIPSAPGLQTLLWTRLHMDPGNSNSSTYVCVAGTLPIEPLPQPREKLCNTHFYPTRIMFETTQGCPSILIG